MLLFPTFMKLAGRRCLVVGAGAVGEPKIASLLASGAAVRVVAPHATARVAAWARAGRISWERRAFRPADLRRTFLVVAATSSPAVHERIFREARRRRVLCNVVDDPPRCDFYYPAVVRRGDLQIAVSTAGRSPALAQRLRRELDRQFGREYARWVVELGQAREALLARRMDRARRVRLLHRLASRQAFLRFLSSGRIFDGKRALEGSRRRRPRARSEVWNERGAPPSGVRK
jgi:precorrin-2 dehydrogenase/sirohydrochlorin ferrochelatase